MTSIGSRFLEAFRFRNLKSDAVPRPPRPADEDVTASTPEPPEDIPNDENKDTTNSEYKVPDDDLKKGRKKRKAKSFFGVGKSKDDPDPKPDDKAGTSANVSIQATGNVLNIIGSSGVRIGNDINYYMGPTNKGNNSESDTSQTQDDIKKTPEIALLMESDDTAEHEYIDFIAKNLGTKWRDIFIKLGYLPGRIDTVVFDQAKYGVSEARYKLLEEWVRNDDVGTLGRLVTILWQEGERQIVQKLAIIYKKNLR